MTQKYTTVFRVNHVSFWTSECTIEVLCIPKLETTVLTKIGRKPKENPASTKKTHWLCRQIKWMVPLAINRHRWNQYIMVRCCLTEDVAIDLGGTRKRGSVKISSCSPQTQRGVEGGGSSGVSSWQQNLMKSWWLRRGKKGHRGCQGRAAAHYCGGEPTRKGGREDMECQGTGCRTDGRETPASSS